MIRYCCNCKTEVAECMGFVNAGDFIKAVDNKIPWFEVRELCGKCVLIKNTDLKPKREQL